MTVIEAVELLGLLPGVPATADQTKRAYLRKLREHPPERDPEGFQTVRSAYDLVKHGYEPLTDDDGEEEECFLEHAALRADHDGDGLGDDELSAAIRPFDMVADEDDALRRDRALVVVEAALTHIESGDVAEARNVVAANPVEVHDGWLDRDLLRRYIGLRELLERISKLPETAPPYFARALRELKEGEPAPALFAFRRKHRRDATHAFQVIRGSETAVLRPMVLLVEPPFRLPMWAKVALVMLLVAIRLLTWFGQ